MYIMMFNTVVQMYTMFVIYLSIRNYSVFKMCIVLVKLLSCKYCNMKYVSISKCTNEITLAHSQDFKDFRKSYYQRVMSEV